MKERRPIVDMSQTFQNTNTAARHSTDRADELTLQDCTRGSDTGQTPLPGRNLPRSPLGPPTATSADNPPERREKRLLSAEHAGWNDGARPGRVRCCQSKH